MRFLRFFRRDVRPHPLAALLEEPSAVKLTERQAIAVRDALWYVLQTSVLPHGSTHEIDAYEALAVVSRRLQPEIGDVAARMIAEADQLRASLDDEAEQKGLHS